MTRFKLFARFALLLIFHAVTLTFAFVVGALFFGPWWAWEAAKDDYDFQKENQT